MLFSSITFLFLFLPVVLMAYHIFPSFCRNGILLIASLFFYAWGEPVYIILMILSILFNYISGIDIGRKLNNRKAARRSLVLALVVNLFLLGFFKYYDFFIDILNVLLPLNLSYRKLSLPIGISFYTFQAISYLIDVYRKDSAPQKNILDFALYISMFPQLIAGPIVRYTEIDSQLKHRTLSAGKFGHGVRYFISGLAEKVILANGIGAIYDNVSTQMASGQTAVCFAWLGAVCYMLQIYFDFGGYSHMAIGLGYMFGFQLPQNFNYPYLSKSITAFWHRWHISLSKWFKEYLYIPLGGNQVCVSRHILNLLIVWTATGIWHGAAWNFVFWGLYYGIILILEKYIWGKQLEKLPTFLQHIYTLSLVLIGWVFFFSNSLSSAWNYLKIMFGIGASGFLSGSTLYLIASNWLILLAGILCSTKIPKQIMDCLDSKNKYIRIALEMLLFLLTIACLVTDTFNPFLYFRF